MKTSLEHLPVNKQEELSAIKEIILECTPKTEMIILYGSYARGDWVEDVYQDNGTTYEYISDFDILVVTTKNLHDMKRDWKKVRSRIDKKNFRTKTSIISHGIHFLNERIEHSYYFFVDVLNEGVLLYDSGNYKLAAPATIGPKKRLEKAQKYFESWMRKGNRFYENFEFNLQKEYFNEAAFMLHQATEHYYAAFSLVLTDYKPKTHDLKELLDRAININEAHRIVFPQQTEEEEYRFNLLKRAYIEARYSDEYLITTEELAYLAERVLILKELIIKLCEEEIEKIKELKEVEKIGRAQSKMEERFRLVRKILQDDPSIPTKTIYRWTGLSDAQIEELRNEEEEREE